MSNSITRKVIQCEQLVILALFLFLTLFRFQRAMMRMTKAECDAFCTTLPHNWVLPRQLELFPRSPSCKVRSPEFIEVGQEGIMALLSFDRLIFIFRCIR